MAGCSGGRRNLGAGAAGRRRGGGGRRGTEAGGAAGAAAGEGIPFGNPGGPFFRWGLLLAAANMASMRSFRESTVLVWDKVEAALAESIWCWRAVALGI